MTCLIIDKITFKKLADLVILSANPIDNIENTRTINYVIQSGKVLNRQQMDELLESCERK